MVLVTSSDSNFDVQAPVSDLDLLWDSEFGARRELVIRCLGIAAGGIAVWIYEGSLIGPAWAVVYFIGLLANYLALRPRVGTEQRSVFLCFATYFVTAITYLSLPLYMIVMGDAALSFCAALAVMAYAVFTLFRSEPPQLVAPFDIAVGWVCASVAAFSFWHVGTTFMAQGLIVMMCLVVGFYYSMALIATRATRAELRLAVQRSFEAQKMESIGRLSGGIAHDFNNILTVLQGNLELYHEVPNGPEQDALVDEARAAGVRATALVSQLLAFARRAPLETRAHDANKVVEELSTLAQRLLPVSIQFENRVPEAGVCVLADANGLHSALLNLILNANDAMEGRGSVVLALDVVSGPAPEGSAIPSMSLTNSHLRFSVADDGPGMSKDVERRALEPFFTTKSVGKGSGLGLSMAVGFAEQSSGALRIKTSTAGTIVAMHLPLCEATLPSV